MFTFRASRLAVQRVAITIAHRNKSAFVAAAFDTQPLPSYYHHIGAEPLVHRTIGKQLERAARLYGDREAVVSCAQRKRLTFAQTLEQADRVAAAFGELGLRRGDRLGIWSPNTVEWYVMLMAAARAGIVAVALNPAYQSPEIAYCLRMVGVATCFVAEEHKTQQYYDLLRAAVPELERGERLIRSDGFPELRAVVIASEKSYPGAYTFNDLLHLATTEQVRAVAASQALINPDSACNIQFTSGTTGQPKAAVLSHNNFVNNGIHIANRSDMNLRPQRICVQVPLFHAFGLVIATMSALAHGSTLVLPSAGFDPTASLRAIESERCTLIYGTPTMYVDLIARQRIVQADVSSAEWATTGGAPCTPHLFGEIRRWLGLRGVRTVFGLTETAASAFFSMTGETMEQTTETVGFVQDHLEVKVIDEEGNVVPMGEPGELCVRGYSTMLGYWADEVKTRETIGEDRWLKTGDQFVLLPDGYGKIVGRLKDVIIRGGENVYPKEVEDFLDNMPQVLECSVFGVPDERLGEAVAVSVRLAADFDTDVERAALHENVRAFCKGRLAYFKVPQYVLVTAALPKTLTGKVQKFMLRDKFVEQQHRNE